MTELSVNILICLSFVSFVTLCGCIRSAVIGYKHGWPIKPGETRKVTGSY